MGQPVRNLSVLPRGYPVSQEVDFQLLVTAYNTHYIYVCVTAMIMQCNSKG